MDEAITAEAAVSKACQRARDAWQQLDRSEMRAALDEADACRVDSDDCALCRYLLEVSLRRMTYGKCFTRADISFR